MPESELRLAYIRSQVQSDLSDNVMPFWTRHTWDDQYGGFLTVVDLHGRPTDTTKWVVMQARMVWTLAAAHDYGLQDRRYLDLASRGVDFITGQMWDEEHGGYFMTTERDGTPANTAKFLYAQEFVLYGLAEYARVAKDSSALAWASKTFDIIQEKTADRELGGHREDFDRAWKPRAKSLGVSDAPSRKTVNTHMHLMEAYTALVLADPQPRYVDALAVITDLLLTRCVHPDGYAIEPNSVDWKPMPDGKGRMSVFYGHDVELAWLLMDSFRALGRSLDDLKKPALTIVDRVLMTGFDHDRGGIGSQGPRGGDLMTDPLYASDRGKKEWWEQAEALVALIRAYRWTGDPKYLDAFEKEWEWVWKYQIDHEAGDWFSDVDWVTGAPINPDDKGLGGWKVCYHNGRALMNVSREIDAILAT